MTIIRAASARNGLGFTVPSSSWAARAVAVATVLAAMSLPASAAQPYSWTGFYIGGDIGLRATQADWTTGPTFFGVPDVPFESYDSAGPRLGAFLGYNWQFAPRWVAGVEADLGWADNSARQPKWLPGVSGGIFIPTFSGDHSTVQTTWDGSLRARLGYLLTPSTLLYGTAGAAWQKFEWSAFCVLCGPAGLGGGDETTRAGWTVGGGVEMAITGNWLARGEYRYSDFGTFDQVMSIGGGPVAFFDVKLATHIFKFGLAYQFGGNARAPAATWPDAPATDWRGAYVGGSLGLMATQSRWTGVSLAGFPAVFTGDGMPEEFNDSAFRGSLLGGYNWTIGSQYVAGVEVDVGYTGNTASQAGYAPGFYGPIGLVILPGDVTKVRTTWDAGLRARFGYLVTPNLLIYGTGGLAVQRYTFTSSFVCGCAIPDGGFAETSKTYLGFSLGGGLETRLWGQWRARAEYRFADFGTQRVSLQHPFYAPTPFVSDLRLTTHTAQFSVIYDWN